MTKTQFRQKTKSMKKDVNKFIDEKIEKLLVSGCIDLESAENDFRLPKCFMSAIGHEIKWQYAPHSKEGKETVENMTHFL